MAHPVVVRSRRPAGAWGRATLVLGLVVLLDQVTKKLVRDGLAVGEEDPVFPALKLVHVQNRGVAFSALEDQTTLVVAAIVLAVGGLVAYFATHTGKPLIWLPTGLLAGGALGNIFDRVREGAVTDFLKLPAWPAFNLADLAITLGVVALLLVVEAAERRDGDPGPA